MHDTPRSKTERDRFAKVGRLEELSGHRGLTGKLWEADGTRWTCHFKSHHITLLPDAWMHTVKLTGRAIVAQGRGRFLDVDSILVLDKESRSTATPTEGTLFWKSPSLDELAEQQSIAAADDLDAIAALWPADDDPDDLLQHILAEREERRKLSEDQGDGA